MRILGEREKLSKYIEHAQIYYGYTEDAAEQLAERAFLLAFEKPEDCDPSMDIEKWLCSLMLDIHERHKQKIEIIHAHEIYEGTKKLGAPTEVIVKHKNLRDEFKRRIGKMDLTTKETLALLSKIYRPEKIGNMLVNADVGPEDLENAVKKCAKNPSLKSLMEQLTEVRAEL